jgi:hypothetical protein
VSQTSSAMKQVAAKKPSQASPVTIPTKMPAEMLTNISNGMLSQMGIESLNIRECYS